MDLIRLVVRRCTQVGVRILLVPEEEIPYPNTAAPYEGYFVVDPNGKTGQLGCAMRAQNAELTLLHEFNHVEQWAERSPAWDAPKLSLRELQLWGMQSGQESLDVLHNWLDHTLELDPATLRDLVHRSITVELDCEQRTARMGHGLVRNWNGPHYIKLCNSYLRAYKFAELTRRWPDNREAQCVLDVMPADFTLDYFGPLSFAEISAFEKSFEN